MLVADLAARTAVEAFLRAAYAALLVQAPFLKIPPISWLANWLFNRLLKVAADRVGNQAGMWQIKFENAKDLREYNEAVEELSKVHDKENPTPEEVENATKAVRERLAALGSFRR